jgi:hypothetical protein
VHGGVGVPYNINKILFVQIKISSLLDLVESLCRTKTEVGSQFTTAAWSSCCKMSVKNFELKQFQLKDKVASLCFTKTSQLLQHVEEN